MPFTFSHPAILLPLRFLPKKWISLTGLVIGSFVPDFEYFLRFKIQSLYSHTISGIFWFDLPLTIVLAFLFHNVVRNSLLENLPKSLNIRLEIYKQFDWNDYLKKNYLIVTLSILVGIVSHLFWDSFTHENGYFVKTIPFLITDIELLNRKFPIFKLFQHSSSFIGGLILIFVIYRMPKNPISNTSIQIRYWIIVIAITVLLFSIKLISGMNYKLYGNLIVTFISSVMIALLFTPMLMKIKNKIL